MADPRIKQIKIKTGVAKRLTKEVVYYGKEATKEEERYKKFEADGKDEYELRKQKEVINESKAMIPDTKGRLIKAKEELCTMIDNEPDLANSEECNEARKILEEADKVLVDPNL